MSDFDRQLGPAVYRIVHPSHVCVYKDQSNLTEGDIARLLSISRHVTSDVLGFIDMEIAQFYSPTPL